MKTKLTFLLGIAIIIGSYAFAQAPLADFTASQTAGCDTLCINFSDLSTNSPTSWNWTFTGGSPSTSTIQNPNFICYGVGLFDVTLVVSNGFGSDTITKINYITVNTSPTVNLGPDQSACDGDIVTLDAGAGAGYIYLWTDASTNQTLDVTVAGTYSVTITDGNGCNETDAVIITVNPLPAADAGVDVTICEGGAVQLNASGGIIYTWSPSTSLSDINISNPVANPVSTTIYTVTVTNANGCTDTDNVIVIVNPNPVVIITCNAPSDSISCDGSAAAILSGGSPPYMYEWSNAAIMQTITNLCQGIYSVTVTDMNGCTAIESVLLNDFCGQPGNISGKVFNDINADCIQDINEDGLQNWLVQAVPGPYYSITNSDGFYSLLVDTGTYTVNIMLPNSLWQQNCPVSPDYYDVNITSYNDTVSNINFGVIADVYCPDLSVDIFTGAVRPCFTSYYYVNYCNNGTIEATNATIEVELDDNMTYAGGTGNFVSQIGNILTFDAGTVIPGQCGSFYLYVAVFCDVSLVGQTMCVEAHIYPDSSCFPADPAWDHSSVAVEGNCLGDSSACFTIYNTGDAGTGDMDGTSEYRIYENNMLVYTGTFQIAGGDSSVFCWSANGNTIRLEADQRPGHPGNSHPQDNVEMCGDSLFVTGQITVITEDDEDNFVEIDCHVAIGSYDPNDKQVKPEGLTETDHFIDSTDVLEYIIRFQNTGTDTAFNVVIRDTLSPYLDITTIEPGASSHPYTLNIYESNILKWTFENILLPDSNVNEPGSNGFVKYKIHQKPGNIIGTIIENNAGIVFDFWEPVITNMVFNTVGNMDSITTNMPIIYDNKFSVKVYPNPFNLTTTFEIKGMNQPVTFELYNIIGKQVRAISDITKNKFVINRENLPDGIYIYKISTKDKIICAGKLIVN